MVLSHMLPETWRSSFALIAALLFVLPAPAQDAPPKEGEPGAKPPEPKTVAEVLKDSDRIDGLFTLYRDRKTGALRMALTADELEKTYLYFTYTENGVPAAGQFRGAFGMSRADVFRVSRYYDRVEFIVENTSYYFDSSKAIARAANANISHAVAAVEKIEAEDSDQGLVVINASNLFLTGGVPSRDAVTRPEQEAARSLLARQAQCREVADPRGAQLPE